MKRLVLALALIISLITPATALAYNPLADTCNSSGTAQQSSACNTTGKDPLTGPNGVIKKVSLVISTIAGAAAVFVIIISGLRLVTNNGDAKKAADARSALLGAVIGLVIIAAAQGIVIFVVSQV